MNQERRPPKLLYLAQYLVLPALFAFYTFAVFVPWVPRSWQPPCNNSWVLVLHNAFVNRMAFGTDVVFTFGPYGFLYFGATPQTYPLTLMGWLLIAAAWCVVVWKTLGFSTLPKWTQWIGAMLVTALTASVDVVDAQIFAFTAFASAAWIISRPRDIPTNVVVGAALALASLVKFSWFIAILPCVAVITFYGLIRERRSALIGAVYAVFLIVLWLVAGQSLASVVNYISSSMEITSGYAEAMQLAHPWGMSNVWSFVFIATALTGLPLVVWFKRDWFTAIALSGITGFLLLIAFKAGFVRHDHHEVVSMAVLASIAIIQFHVVAQRVIPSIAAVLSLVLFGACMQLHDRNPSFEERLGQTIRLGGLTDLLRFLGSRKDVERHFANDMKPIAERQPFDLPDGTVDLYPWGGIDAMYANKLNVRHRPVFESYSAITDTLAKRNRDFLLTESAPDHLLFAVRSLDQRFPSMDDGLSWPEILSHYDIEGEQSGYLLMSRRETPVPYRLIELQETGLQPETMVPLPEADALWGQIELPLKTRGRILKQFYKPAVLILAVQMADGSTHAFRFLPSVASAGFLISPVIVNNAAFDVFQKQQDDPRLAALRPRAIAITGENGFAEHYDFQHAKVRFSRLEFGK